MALSMMTQPKGFFEVKSVPKSFEAKAAFPNHVIS